jgi:hypothetical protein
MCPGPVFGALESATRETEPGRESPHRQSVDDDTCGRIPTGAEVSVADGEPGRDAPNFVEAGVSFCRIRALSFLKSSTD